ncbi:MAG: hypothetical protein CMJ83_20880 [Planctomycetes bacterium]|nr:hypothetical protein [Planctomycetota bacterium]
MDGDWLIPTGNPGVVYPGYPVRTRPIAAIKRKSPDMSRTTVMTLLALVLSLLTPTAPAQSVEVQKDRIVTKVKKMDIVDHGDVVIRLRKQLDERLLTPKKKWQQYKPDGDEAGINRILHRGRWERQTYVRGGGAYFSFETRSNDYDDRPDIELQDNSLTSGFAGGDFGVVMALPQIRRLGDAKLDGLPELITVADPKVLKQKLRAVRLADAQTELGRVYAVRSVRWGESDRIAVVQILGMDEDGITFSWRVLEKKPTPAR